MALSAACYAEQARTLAFSEVAPSQSAWFESSHQPDTNECGSLSWSPALDTCLSAYAHERGGASVRNPRHPDLDPFEFCEGIPEQTISLDAATCVIATSTSPKPDHAWDVQFGSTAYTARRCHWVGFRDSSRPGCDTEVIVLDPITGTVLAHHLAQSGVP